MMAAAETIAPSARRSEDSALSWGARPAGGGALAGLTLATLRLGAFATRPAR